jgi:hypothetical protein
MLVIPLAIHSPREELVQPLRFEEARRDQHRQIQLAAREKDDQVENHRRIPPRITALEHANDPPYDSQPVDSPPAPEYSVVKEVHGECELLYVP